MGDEEVRSDVKEMNKSFRFETAEGESIKEEVIEDDSKPDNEDEEKGPEEGTEEEIKDEEIPPEEIEEGTEEEEEKPEEDERDKIIAELREKLAKKEAKEESEPEPEPEQGSVEDPLRFEPQKFIEEDEGLEDLVRDPERLNEVFNSVYQRAVTDTRRVLGEGILRSIPDVVRASVDMIDKLKQMNTKFYSDNEDLKPFQKVVASVFEEIVTESPGKDMMELLPLVAEETRKRLELHKKAVQPKNNKPPRLPSRKRRTTIPEEKPNTNPLLDELKEMNKIIRR